MEFVEVRSGGRSGGKTYAIAQAIARNQIKLIIKDLNNEIEEALKSNYKVLRVPICEDDTFPHYVNGKIDCLRGLQGYVEELEKKYLV